MLSKQKRFFLAALKVVLDRNKKTLLFGMLLGGTAHRAQLPPFVMVGSKWAKMLDSIFTIVLLHVVTNTDENCMHVHHIQYLSIPYALSHAMCTRATPSDTSPCLTAQGKKG